MLLIMTTPNNSEHVIVVHTNTRTGQLFMYCENCKGYTEYFKNGVQLSVLEDVKNTHQKVSRLDTK